jgi:hypothetical protein
LPAEHARRLRKQRRDIQLRRIVINRRLGPVLRLIFLGRIIRAEWCDEGIQFRMKASALPLPVVRAVGVEPTQAV